MSNTFLLPTLTISLALLVTLLSPAAAQDNATPCYAAFRECDFKFVNTTGLQRFDISKRPDRSFTMRIVSKDASEILGVLNSNDLVPEFVSKNKVTPITALGNPSFTPSHFKPYKRGWGSGVGHQTFHGNQLRVASGKCIRVYFSSYQVLDGRNGSVVMNVNGLEKEDNKCVVFRAMGK